MKSIKSQDKLEELGLGQPLVSEKIKAEDCMGKVKGLEELDKELTPLI